MECEESGSSLGEQEDLRAEVTRSCKRLRELCSRLRRGEDDSGLQSDCDESMLVIANGSEAEVRALKCTNAYLYPCSSSDLISFLLPSRFRRGWSMKLNAESLGFHCRRLTRENEINSLFLLYSYFTFSFLFH